MYSVPDLPEAGSSVTVHIKAVTLNPHSVLVEFGGNLNHGQEASEEYQQLKKELDVPRKRQNTFDGKPGDICLVYEDRSWQRVRILSKSEQEYKVFLIDDGKLLWVSSKVLTKCPQNLCSLPAKVEFCILANVTPLCLESTWSLVASKFIRSLCGKNISGCVQDVIMPSRIILLDIPSISKQMYELGFASKMTDEKFKSLVMNSLQLPRNPSVQTDLVTTNGQHDQASDPDKLNQYLYPELLPGTVEIVTITQVIHPLKIYCKLRVFSQELEKLSGQLQDYYEDGFSVQMPTQLSDGSPCATKGSDGKWYRSVLQQNNVSDVVKVFHVDYGIGDFVQLRNIRPLSARFFRLPVVTYACSLHGIIDKGVGWRTDQIDYLKSIVLEQILVGKFEHHNVNEGIYYVTLYGNDNVNVNDTFGRREQCLSRTEKICGDPTLETLNKVTYKNVHDRNASVHSPRTNTLTGCSDSLEDVNIVRLSKTEEKGRGTLNAPAAPPLQNDEYVELPPKIKVGTKVNVQITCVQSVSQFYGHFAQNTCTVRKMTKDIQQLCYKRPQAKFSVSPNMMCLAKYTDGQWHRGQIQSMHPKILVHFVDYGDLVVLDKSDILPLPSAIASVPIQAVQFELFDVTLPESCKLNEWFKNYTTDCMFTVAVKQNSSGKLSVEMYEDKTNLNLKIKEMWNKTKRKGSNFDKGNVKTFKESSGGMESRGATSQARGYTSNKVQKPGVQGALEQNSISGHSNGTNGARPNQVVSYPKLANLPSKSLNAGYVSDVYVSHCNSPSSFFVQLTSDEDEIFSILDQLNSSQLSDADVEPKVLQPGDLVRAEYPADGAWYRAVVQNKRDGMVQVQFIDFGNEATLLPIKVKQLGKQFLCTPRFSIHCMLEDGRRRGKRDWTEEEITAFKNATGENGEKKIQCKFIQEDSSFWRVHLEHLEGPLFNSSKSGAQTESKMNSHEDAQSFTFKEPAVNQGQTIEAYASSIVGPNYFWCQFKNTEELDRISLLAQEIGNCAQTKAVHKDQLCQGGLCLARFSDQLWYRAQVIKADDDKVSVLFIDYGNESEADLDCVKSLPAKLLQSPPQAFLCQLESLGSIGGTWSDAANEEFFEFLVDEPLKVTIQNMVMCSDLPKCPQYCVLMECKGLIVNNLMKDYWCDPKPQVVAETQDQSITHPRLMEDGKTVVQQPSAQCLPQASDLPSRVIEPGSVSEVYVSHINTLTSFFVQLVADEDTLFSLTELLNSPQPSEEDEMPALSVQQGNLVKAMFPEDDSWYRAVVKDTTENGMIHVEFIDFGNEATVSPLKVCRLEEQLLSFPRFSIHCSCSLDDRFKMEKGLKEQVFLFKKIFGEAGENTLSCNFIKEGVVTWEVKMTPSSGTSESSEKWDNLEVNALPVLPEPVKQTQLHFKKPDVSLGQTVEAFASCIVGPNYFWCQFSNSEMLDQIALAANKHGSSSEMRPVPLDDLDTGSPCLACFSDDQLWYRAQIISKSSNTASVLFIDFGNESDICEGSVKALPSDLLESPPQAFLCRLDGFDSSEGSWDSAAIDDFYEQLVEKPLKVTVQCIEDTMDSSRPPYCVKVESPECFVNESMRKFWNNSAKLNQNSAEVIESCDNSIPSQSEDQPISKDKTSDREDDHVDEPHCPEKRASPIEMLVVNEDLHDAPENKVEETDAGPNSDVIANDPARTNADVEIHDVSHKPDDIPVVSSELLSGEDMEGAPKAGVPMASSRSTTWVAGLENQMSPMVCTEDSCDSKCIFK